MNNNLFFKQERRCWRQPRSSLHVVIIVMKGGIIFPCQLVGGWSRLYIYIYIYNLDGIRWFSKKLCVLLLRMKVPSALKGIIGDLGFECSNFE